MQQVAYAVALEGQVGVGGVHHKGQAALTAHRLQLGFAEAQQGAGQADRAMFCVWARREGRGKGSAAEVLPPHSIGTGRWALCPYAEGSPKPAHARPANPPVCRSTAAGMQARPATPLACSRRSRKVSAWSSAWCASSRWRPPPTAQAVSSKA